MCGGAAEALGAGGMIPSVLQEATSPSCPHSVQGPALETRIITTHPVRSEIAGSAHSTRRASEQDAGRMVGAAGGCWGLRALTGATVPPDTLHLLACGLCVFVCNDKRIQNLKQNLFFKHSNF